MVNDFPLDSYYNQWKNGLTPSQQLWGKVELDREEGFELIILPHQKYKSLDKIGNIIRIEHFDQQVRALLIKNEIDIIYAPFAAATTKFLLILKLFGFINTPIVAMIHYPLLGSSSNNKIVKYLGKKLMMGFDRMIFLSRNIKSDNITAFSLCPQEHEKRFVHLNWGAETAFYDKTYPSINLDREDYFISSGQTDRDFDTLIEAFRHIDFKLKIYAKPNYKPKTKDIPKNVEIHTKAISSRELIDLYKNSLAVLICFKITQKSTLGLTILFEAMALGKPVIITENSYIDIDVEKEGIGFWVAEGDVQGWVSKIKILIDSPEMIKKMSHKALNLHKSKYNMDNFAQSLKTVLQELSEELKNY
jgi:glycosyltransferase involved in cell wall biosynthesis